MLDTRFASPSHHILSDVSSCPPPLTYRFNSPRDVDGYWLNLRAVLLYTPYGFTRFADPTIGQFVDTKAPILSVERPQDLVTNDTNTPPTLPHIEPTRLKVGAPQASSIIDMGAPETVTLLGVGGFHASLYLFKAPFEEMGYGTTEQGVCTQYEPPYPSPCLQLQPAVREDEMSTLLGGPFEPGLKTTGDGAFWPWTVQLFFSKLCLLILSTLHMLSTNPNRQKS